MYDIQIDSYSPATVQGCQYDRILILSLFSASFLSTVCIKYGECTALDNDHLGVDIPAAAVV
jgi:hypothetical protein